MMREVWAPSLGMDRESATKVEAANAGHAACKWVEEHDPRNDCLVANGDTLVVNVVEHGPVVSVLGPDGNYSSWEVSGEPRIHFTATLLGGAT